MAAPSPQQAISGNRVAIGGLIFLAAFLVLVIWFSLSAGVTPNVVQVVLLVLPALFLPFLTIHLLRVNRNFQRQVAPRGGHHCICGACGRFTRPVGPPSPVSPRHKSTPQEDLLSLRPALALLITVAVLMLIGLVGLVITRDAGTTAVQALMGLDGIVLGLILLIPIVGICWILRIRRRSHTTIAALGPEHGCSCRWCGAAGEPLQSAGVQ